MIAALALSGGAALADWQDDYKAALAALDRSDPERAILLLKQAIKDKPKERASAIKTTGMFFDPYLPHYYLGLAYSAGNDCARAIEEFKISASQGVIGKYSEQNSRLESHRRLCEQQIAAGGAPPAPPPRTDDAEARALARAKESSGEALQSAGSFLQRRGRELAPHERATVETAIRELSQATDTATIVRRTAELKGAVEAAEGRLTARAARPGPTTGTGSAPPPRGDGPAREPGQMGKASPAGGARDVPAAPGRGEPAPPSRPAPGPATRVAPPVPERPETPADRGSPERGDRLSPEAAARVRRGVESFYRGDDEGAIAALSSLPQEQAEAYFYLGSALYRKFLLGREQDESLREEAARDFQRVAELAPGYRPDPRYISPKLIAFYERTTGQR